MFTVVLDPRWQTKEQEEVRVGGEERKGKVNRTNFISFTSLTIFKCALPGHISCVTLLSKVNSLIVK